jgi:hypothetical protein
MNGHRYWLKRNIELSLFDKPMVSRSAQNAHTFTIKKIVIKASFFLLFLPLVFGAGALIICYVIQTLSSH